MTNPLQGLVLRNPVPQTAFDLFQGEWAYRIPVPGVSSGAGEAFLHKHPSVWLAEESFGSLRGMSCLELGPNEGEVSFHLHHAGCQSILSIEARVRSFLKCLVVKNFLHLHSVEYRLGDFVEFLATTDQTFDFGVVAGVLYHMHDPVRLLELISRRCQRIAIATHYFHEKILAYDPKVDQTGLPTAIWNFPNPSGEAHHGSGISTTYYKYVYGGVREYHETHGHGGPALFANMITRDEIIRILDHFGMKIVGKVIDDEDGPRGPHIHLIAARKSL